MGGIKPIFFMRWEVSESYLPETVKCTKIPPKK